MNILCLCEKTDGSDGWSRYTGDLIKSLKARGHTTYVLDRKSQIPKPLQMLTRPFLAPFFAWRLQKIVNELEIDIIHITVEPYALIVPFLPKRIQKKVVLTLHGSYAVRPLLMWQTRWLAYQYYKRIPRFIAVSHYTKKRVIEELEKKGKRNISSHIEQHATVIHNGVNIRPFLPPLHIPPPCPPPMGEVLPPHFAKASRGKPGEGKVKTIIHVGGIKPIKGVLEALAGCAIYRDQYSANFHLSIIGRFDPHDAYVQKVRARIADSRLENHVTLCGFVSESELQQAYQNADLLLLPSRTFRNTFEGFGLVFLEANAYGIPVIGPGDSGAKEAIKEGVSGYHVDPKNPEAVAEQMHRILDEKHIDYNACRRWAKEHSAEKMAGTTEKVYQSLRQGL
ncbi:glycosyltransferase family 4 protein [Candidatus Peregrinibacteria bacterium]|nr:glycosyltransferase family 4 protein [Candidatus Peregrinibacteria bacterium]